MFNNKISNIVEPVLKCEKVISYQGHEGQNVKKSHEWTKILMKQREIKRKNNNNNNNNNNEKKLIIYESECVLRKFLIKCLIFFACFNVLFVYSLFAMR